MTESKFLKTMNPNDTGFVCARTEETFTQVSSFAYPAKHSRNMFLTDKFIYIISGNTINAYNRFWKSRRWKWLTELFLKEE